MEEKGMFHPQSRHSKEDVLLLNGSTKAEEQVQLLLTLATDLGFASALVAGNNRERQLVVISEILRMTLDSALNTARLSAEEALAKAKEAVK